MPRTAWHPSGRECGWRPLHNIYKNNIPFNLRHIPEMLRISTPGERCWCRYVLGYPRCGLGVSAPCRRAQFVCGLA